MSARWHVVNTLTNTIEATRPTEAEAFCALADLVAAHDEDVTGRYVIEPGDDDGPACHAFPTRLPSARSVR